MSKYSPIEFFLARIKDNSLTTWILDQVGCLRSVFKIYVCNENDKKDIIYVGDARIQIIRTEEYFEITSDDAITISSFENHAKCLHIKDGTAIIFMIIGENLIGYQFCFEDAPDEMFQMMIQGE